MDFPFPAFFEGIDIDTVNSPKTLLCIEARFPILDAAVPDTLNTRIPFSFSCLGLRQDFFVEGSVQGHEHVSSGGAAPGHPLVAYLDKRGNVLACNETMMRILGLTPSACKGKDGLSLWLPQSARDNLRLWLSDPEPEQPHWPLSCQSLVRSRDHGEVSVQWVVWPVRDRSGRTVGLRLMGNPHGLQDASDPVDISPDARYRALFAHSPLGMFRSTLEGQFLEVNPALARMLGYDRPESVISEIDDIGQQVYVRGEERRTIVDSQREAEGFSHFLNAYRRKDGSIFSANLYLHTVRDEQGEPLCLEGIVEDVSERIERETQLRQSERRYRELVETLQEGVWEIDAEGYTTYVNPAMSGILEYEAHQMEGRHLFDFMDERGVADAQERLRQRREGEREQHEFTFISASGQPVYTLINTVPLCDEHGAYSGALAGISDITERKIAELKLEEAHRAMVEAERLAGMGHWIWNPQTGQTQWSSGMCKIFGVEPERGVPDFKMFLEWVHPEDRDAVKQALQRSLESGQYEAEHRIHRLDNGEIRWLQARGEMQTDNLQTPRVQLGVAMDVTERKAMMEELMRHKRSADLNSAISRVFLTRPTEALFHDVLDVILEALESPVGYFGYIDEHGDLVCPSMSGEVWEKCQIPGKDTVFPKESWGGLWGTSLRECRTCVAHEGLNPPPGHLPLQCALVVPILHQQQLIGQIVVANRVAGYSEVHRTLLEEASLQTAPVLSSWLAKEREQKKHEALEAQYLQAQKMESVGRLAGGVAHDFNNLLGAILMRTELAMGFATPGDPISHHLQEIQNAAQRSAELTRQLLAFARKQTVKPEVVSLNDAVVGMLNMLRRLIGEDVAMVWKPAASLWSVEIDPAQISQIITNLCVNARDAIASTGEVVLSTANVQLGEDQSEQIGVQPGDYVRLRVEDDGCGMSEEVQKHIFEPFFTTKGVGRGTGLGLATVYGIAEQNLGRVVVDSVEGEGTRFDVFLPRSHQSQQDAEPELQAPPPRGRGETILYVEDDEIMLMPVVAILESLGYHVLAAETPKKAIELAQGHDGTIDLLLTDVVMPEMNGMELAKKLNTIQPGLECLFTSGYTDDVLATRGKLDPETRLIQKPYRIKELADTIRSVLKSRPR